MKGNSKSVRVIKSSSYRWFEISGSVRQTFEEIFQISFLVSCLWFLYHKARNANKKTKAIILQHIFQYYKHCKQLLSIEIFQKVRITYNLNMSAEAIFLGTDTKSKEGFNLIQED